MNFTIEDAKRVQRDLKLGDRHVAYIDPDEGFVMAHTDDERATIDLATCKLHSLLALDPGVNLAGWYEINPVEDKLFGRPLWKVEGLAL